MKVSVIGLGEIGFETFKEISKKIEVYGYEINKKRLAALRIVNKGYKISDKLIKSDIYIITVYSIEQVFSVLSKMSFDNHPLVVIESTVNPTKVEKLAKYSAKNNFDLVFFPHRYNPGDKNHHIFNLDRIIGGVTENSTKRALDFYKNFMDPNLIHVFDYKIASLSKIVENAYRFMEISIAQYLKINCDKFDIDFNDLRNACNTKWNINIKEARDGIKGKCLPKDTSLLLNYFDKPFINYFIKHNEYYKKNVGKN